MNKKLFYILLTVLTGYGLTMSTLTHGIGVRESIFFIFNIGAEVVSWPIILFYSLFGSLNPNFTNVFLVYVIGLTNLIFWSPIAFGISYCFSKEKKFLSRPIKTKYKILVISVILLVFIFIPILLFSGPPQEMWPRTIEISNSTGFVVIDVNPESFPANGTLTPHAIVDLPPISFQEVD